MAADAQEPRGESEGGLGKAIADAAKAEAAFLQEHRDKQERMKREKVEVEARLQEAVEAEDASAAASAREEIQFLEDKILISEGRIKS